MGCWLENSEEYYANFQLQKHQISSVLKLNEVECFIARLNEAYGCGVNDRLLKEQVCLLSK